MIAKKISSFIQNDLQARLATEFVQKASFFNSEIRLIKNGRSVVGKSITGVMALAVGRGEEITLIADGNDEQQAVVALEKLLLSRNDAF